MHPNAQAIRTFYEAFGRRDAKTMVALYAPDATFSDPVFPALRGAEVGAMWTMLCERARDLSVEARDIQADDTTGKAHWDARYTFSATGRQVLNRVDATFELRDGKIVAHRDAFDLWAWSGMALGLTGRLLGWSGAVQSKIRKQGDDGLRLFIAKQKG